MNEDNINISFLPVVPNTIRFNHIRWKQHLLIYPLLVPMINQHLALDQIHKPDLDFKAEIHHLPFKLNLRDGANLTHVQQGQFKRTYLWPPEVFLLHDKDLRFCNSIKHTIPTTIDIPVYLPPCTTPPQLQGEVHMCTDAWLWQGIIRPHQSSYASQVVIVCKRTGEIHLCTDYQKLNSISKKCISITKNRQSPAGYP